MKLPEIGQLTSRVRLFEVTGINDDRELKGSFWSKVEVVGGSTYWDSAAISETVTHRVWLRWMRDKTSAKALGTLSEVECEGVRYRVKRITDANFAKRFTLLEVEELAMEA